jgi:L-threonylcarbamoyladenylate synthase
MKRAPARIYRGTGRNLDFLAQRLRLGEIVAVPTETVYGLAGNALDEAACERIFRAKGRPHQDPLIVHVHSLGELDLICRRNPAAELLMRRFWPGPLTLILPKTSRVPALVTAGLSSVAVRMPQHPLFRRLLAKAGVPLAAPSANPFGYVSPTSAQHVRSSLGGKIQHILDGGASRIGLESTIVDVRPGRRPRLLRPGAITQSQIEEVLGVRLVRPRVRKSTHSTAQLAPGMLHRHYSPYTPVILHRELKGLRRKDHAYVHLGRPAGQQADNVFWLDERGSLAGAARRLFATLRKLDAMGFAAIHVQLAQGGELAAAINDRLERAAAR